MHMSVCAIHISTILNFSWWKKMIMYKLRKYVNYCMFLHTCTTCSLIFLLCNLKRIVTNWRWTIFSWLNTDTAEYIFLYQYYNSLFFPIRSWFCDSIHTHTSINHWIQLNWLDFHMHILYKQLIHGRISILFFLIILFNKNKTIFATFKIVIIIMIGFFYYLNISLGDNGESWIGWKSRQRCQSNYWWSKSKCQSGLFRCQTKKWIPTEW